MRKFVGCAVWLLVVLVASPVWAGSVDFGDFTGEVIVSRDNLKSLISLDWIESQGEDVQNQIDAVQAGATAFYSVSFVVKPSGGQTMNELIGASVTVLGQEVVLERNAEQTQYEGLYVSELTSLAQVQAELPAGVQASFEARFVDNVTRNGDITIPGYSSASFPVMSPRQSGYYNFELAKDIADIFGVRTYTYFHAQNSVAEASGESTLYEVTYDRLARFDSDFSIMVGGYYVNTGNIYFYDVASAETGVTGMVFSATETGVLALTTPSRYNLTMAWSMGGFARPHSAVYDPASGYIYVSNVNGDPLAIGGTGYISRLTANGTVLDEQWYGTRAPGGPLSAPKGLAVSGGVLYITDINRVVTVDISSRTQLGNYSVLGTHDFRSVVADDQGLAYVADASDSSDYAIWLLQAGELTGFAERDGRLTGVSGLGAGQDLLFAGSSNGLYATDGAAEDFFLALADLAALGVTPAGDEAEFYADGHDVGIISPDYGKRVHLTLASGSTQGPTGLCYVPELGLLVVPTYDQNRVIAYTPNLLAATLTADPPTSASLNASQAAGALTPRALEPELDVAALDEFQVSLFATAGLTGVTPLTGAVSMTYTINSPGDFGKVVALASRQLRFLESRAVDKIDLVKLYGQGQSKVFSYADSVDAFDDGTWCFVDENLRRLGNDETISAGDTVRAVAYVRDGGPYDSGVGTGVVIDPCFLKEGTGHGGGGGGGGGGDGEKEGGCAMAPEGRFGLEWLLLLVAGAWFVVRRRHS